MQRQGHSVVRYGVMLTLMLVPGASLVACGSPDVDREFPPGNPVLEPGDNPVLGSDGPGAIVETDDTNYGLLVLMAVLLIAAGLLLVRVERWERRRAQAAEDGS